MEYIDKLINEEEQTQENVHRKITGNGTPYSDKDWKAWYGHKSNKESFIEQEELLENNQD